MESIVLGKMKRKGFDEVYDDFSDFSLSAPATKIRRLDAEFPPIMEDRQPVVSSMLEDELSEGEMSNAAPNVGSIRNEPFLPPEENEERALVLYKPVYDQLGPSLRINPELITDLKNCAFWHGNRGITENNFGKDDRSSPIDCLAMIPWVPPQAFPTAPGVEASTSRSRPLEEAMEAEVDGASSMEIEDDQLGDSGVEGENFVQWKQHCLIPELSQSTATTPITWL